MGLWCDKQILQQNDKDFGYILDPFTIFKNGKEYAGNNNLLPLDGSHNKKYDHGSAGETLVKSYQLINV